MESFKLFKPHKPPKEYNHLILNNRTFWDYFYRLQELQINMFEWKNLPESVDSRFIELTLCERGYCVYFNDDILGNLALPCYYAPPLNVYRIPTVREAFSVNGYHKKVTEKDSVLIFNNYLHTPSVETLLLFAGRLCEIERTIDVNVKSQKMPVAIICDENERLTFENVYKMIDGNKPVILGSKNGLDLKNIASINTQAPFVSDKLIMLKRQIWNEALTFIGIDNVSTDKKERLVTDEVESNLGAVQAQRFVALNARREAVNKINKMFGTNIEVNYRMPQETVSNLDYPLERGENEDGEVYN